jgi:hypothetical protein
VCCVLCCALYVLSCAETRIDCWLLVVEFGDWLSSFISFVCTFYTSNSVHNVCVPLSPSLTPFPFLSPSPSPSHVHPHPTFISISPRSPYQGHLFDSGLINKVLDHLEDRSRRTHTLLNSSVIPETGPGSTEPALSPPQSSFTFNIVNCDISPSTGGT